MSVHCMVDFENWFDGDDEPSVYLNHSIHDPAKTADPNRLIQYDKDAAGLIRDLEKLVANLTLYRRAIAERYNELQTAPYTLRLSCIRYKSWYDKRVTYTIALTRVYADGAETAELTETYLGTERRKALARFEELKKSHAGIETRLDIEKARWE